MVMATWSNGKHGRLNPVVPVTNAATSTSPVSILRAQMGYHQPNCAYKDGIPAMLAVVDVETEHTLRSAILTGATQGHDHHQRFHH